MSPIVETLRRIAGDESLRKVVSYREEFHRLWAVPPSVDGLRAVAKGLEESGVRTLAIVWDGAPHLETGPVDTTPYLTPLDWVVALACELHADHKDHPGFTVWILRLLRDRSGASETERFVESIPGGQIPGIRWAHVVRLTGDEGDSNGPAALVDAVKGEPLGHPPGRTDPPAPDALAPVRGAWTFALTRPQPDAGHHDLANLLGPQLLLEEAAVRDAAPLKQLVQSLGLYPARPLGAYLTEVNAGFRSAQRGGRAESDDARAGYDPGPAGHGRRDGESREPRDAPRAAPAWFRDDEHHWRRRLAAAGPSIAVFFVDDMWRLGWGAVLCRAFGAQPVNGRPLSGAFTEIGSNTGIRVLASDSHKPVVEALKKGQDLRFAFSLAPGQPPNAEPRADPEMAVLDLRLFAGQDLDEEAKFFKSLIEIAGKRADCGNLPWPPIDEDELRRIGDWCQTAIASHERTVTRNDQAYLEGMTLLPRLVALADPSYPVLVFSSTGRRLVAERLRPYGNLITAFEKPQVATLGDEDLSFRVASGFRRALGDALDLLAARRRCLALPARPVADRHVPVAEASTRPAHAEGRWTVQVFLDETGDPGLGPSLTVGGLAVVFPPDVNPSEFAGDFWTTDLRNQQRNDFGAFKKALRDGIRIQAKRIETSSPDVRIAAVAVNGQSETADSEYEGDPLFDTRSHDNLHRELVRVVLEGAVYDVARRLVPDDLAEVDLYVWLATRRTELPHSVASEKALEVYRQKLRQQWGICTEWTNNKEYILYMREDSARPLVEVVRQRYAQSTFRAVGRTAVAVGLNRHGANFLHYVADALLSHPRKVPDVWWGRGFGKKNANGQWPSRYDERLQALLRAQRHLLAGRTVEALAEGTGHDTGDGNSLELRIQHRLRETLPTLNGADVLRLKSLLQVAPAVSD